MLARLGGKALLAAESLQFDKVSALPLEFRLLKSCGSWQADGKRGYYRIIVADVHDGAGSELYVQWIAQATQDAHPVVVKPLGFRN